MKTLRIATMLASLLLMSGCTTARAIQETPSPTFSSAGKEVNTATKKAAEVIKQQGVKAAEKIQEKDSKQEPEEKPQAGNNQAEQQSSSQGNSDPAPKSTPVSQQNTAPDPTPVPTPEPEPEPVYEEPVYQKPEPTPAPAPAPPPQACPGGKNPDLGCEVILDTNYYRETFSSYSEAMSKGQYYMDEVMYIGDIEITSYSVQEVYRNDHSTAYYGLNLWSSGSLIQ